MSDVLRNVVQVYPLNLEQSLHEEAYTREEQITVTKSSLGDLNEAHLHASAVFFAALTTNMLRA